MAIDSYCRTYILQLPIDRYCSFKPVQCSFKPVQCAFKPVQCPFKPIQCSFKPVQCSLLSILFCVQVFILLFVQ